MNKEELNMDKVFREKLEGFTVTPSTHVWDNIKNQLTVQQRQNRIVMARWIAAAAVVILAFLAGWYFNEKSDQIVPVNVENNVSPATENQSQPNTIVNQSPSNNLNNDITLNDNNTLKTENTIELASLNSETIETNHQENRVLDNSGFVAAQKFSMEMLNNIEAFFNVQQPQITLKKQEVKNIEIAALTDEEKVLIAENASNLKSASEVENNWKMGLNISPGYSSNQTNHTNNYAQNMTYSGSEGNSNIGGGISIQYKTGKRWSIESGIYYAQNGQQSSNSPGAVYSGDYSSLLTADEKSYLNTAVNVVDGQMVMNSTAGVIQFSETPRGAVIATDAESSYNGANALLTSSEFSQVFDFVEIPLYLRYTVVDAKFGVQLMGGVNAGIVAGNNVIIKNQIGSQNIGKTEDISTLNLSGTIGVGLNYALGRRISVAVEPRLNYYLNSINQNPDVDLRPYRIGVYTGLYYEF